MDLLHKYQESNSEEDKVAFEEKQVAFFNEYSDILSAVENFNNAVIEIASEEVELSVDAIDTVVFMDAMEGQSFDITAETFDLLYPIVRFCDNVE